MIWSTDKGQTKENKFSENNIILVWHFVCLLSVIYLPFYAFSQTNHEVNNKDLKQISGFLKNKGQIIDQCNKPNPVVLYLLNTPGMNVQVRKGGFSYDVYRISNIEHRMLNIEDSRSALPVILHDSSVFNFHRIDFDLIGSNTDCEIITSGASVDYLNYYTTGTPVEGATMVHSYQSVIFKNIYPSIDLEMLTDPQTGFKYNFVVHPGGNFKSIQIKISEPKIRISFKGSLIIPTSFGKINEEIPRSFSVLNNVKQDVKTRFSKVSENVYGISVIKRIEKDATLIIDPVPIRLWGTYFAGTGSLANNTRLTGCSTDKFGNVFVAGISSSTNNIATSGIQQSVFGGGTEDALLAKFNPTGQRLWCTYYGGSGTDWGRSCIVDKNNRIYLSGSTESDNNISTPGAHQPIRGGDFDDFIAKFTTDGLRLWGTYYGGSFQEGDGNWGTSIVTDKFGYLYMASATKSLNNISTPGAHQASIGGSRDAYLVKFDSLGVRQWGTYYGGLLDEFSRSCAIDSNGHVFLCGQTVSVNNIATPGAFQISLTGFFNGFLAEFNSDGQRQWGTYYGTNMAWVNSCAATRAGNIYIFGRTLDNSGISTLGSHQPVYGGGNGDAFLVKFDVSGSRLWGTYYGGSELEEGWDCKTDDSGYVFIAGHTASTNAIATCSGFQTNLLGSNNVYLAKFDSTGQRIWATYYGGSGNELYPSCTVDSHHGNIFLAGWTYSSDHISTPGSFQPVFSPTSDGFLARLMDCKIPGVPGPIIGQLNICDSTLGLNYSIDPVPFATGYIWNVPTGASIIAGQGTTSITVNFNSNAVSGFIIVRVSSQCADCDSSFVSVVVHSRPVPVIDGNNSPCTGTPITYSTVPGKSQYQWSYSAGGSWVSGGTPIDPTVSLQWNTPGLQWVKVNYTDTNNCIAIGPTQFDVTVLTGTAVDVSISSSANNICAGTSITFNANTTFGGITPHFQWKVNGITSGTDDSVFVYIPLSNDIIQCILTSSNTVCVSNNPATSNSITMVVNPLQPVSVVVLPTANPVCAGTSVTFNAVPTNGGTIPVYQWKVNGINTGNNLPIFSYIPVNGDAVSCVLTSNVNCPIGNPASSNSIAMVVNTSLPADLTIAASANPFCPGSAVTFIATPVNGGSVPFYQWKVNGANAGGNSPTYTYSPVNGDSVRCIITSNLNCVTGNPASSAKIIMLGTLAPTVIFTSCFDTLTTVNAKPFKLKGGIPLGGTYSGAGVNPITVTFTPSIAGIGLKSIVYTYTNVALCSANKTKTIIVQSIAPFTCGNNLTDIRDNKIYPSVQIGSQCWMAANLNYGNQISPSQVQFDNCIAEKYCYNDNPLNCTNNGGLYQWDEMMKYDDTQSGQGLCPPGWHVPAENDWITLFNMYQGNGLAGRPLQDSIINGFRAKRSGVFYLNSSWKFMDFATIFWSSTSWGQFEALSHGMNAYNFSVSIYQALRANSFPARCLKD